MSVDLTPPTKKKAAAAPKAEKAPKVTKEPKEKKPRAPRTDYGFSPHSVIHVVAEKAKTYRGHRLAWYNSVAAFDGKTVEAWLASKKDSEDPPRGWLRFFVQDGTVNLERPAAPEAEAA